MIQIASGKSNLKKVCLELGGKSPMVVFADADRKISFRLTLKYTRSPMFKYVLITHSRCGILIMVLVNLSLFIRNILSL